MKVRIGIDVGGTFTDAVAINNDTYELIGTVKVPTTHTAKEGVAAGIVEVLHKGDGGKRIRPEDVTFIAHGTTQATNALLEGDVANVGIVTMGSGLQGAKSRSDTAMGSIELAAGQVPAQRKRLCGYRRGTGRCGRSKKRGAGADWAGSDQHRCRRGIQRG